MASPRTFEGNRRMLLAVVAVGVAGAFFVTTSVHHTSGGSPSPDAIRVVDSAAARGGNSPAVVPPPGAAPVEAARPMARVLAEAPAPLRQLHDDVASGGKDDRATRDEGVLRQAFSSLPAVRFTELAVSCGDRRCEVHGMAEGDETATRLAVRDGSLLDRLDAAGYTSGMDMVSGRGAESEVVVYLDRTGT